jgi:hypothetical protein
MKEQLGQVAVRAHRRLTEGVGICVVKQIENREKLLRRQRVGSCCDCGTQASVEVSKPIPTPFWKLKGSK